MRRRPGGVLEATVFAVVGVAILSGLGIWQLDRKVWKENLIASLTTRLAQMVTASQPASGGISSETSDVWETFFQLGEGLAATDTPERETLTAAVLAMRR